MPIYLFTIELEDDETFCFGLHVDDMAQAKEMLSRMSEAVFDGELESPDMHWHEVDKKRLN